MGSGRIDISFCTTHLNSWPATQQTLDTLWPQLAADCEVIEVDAGSTDASRAYLETFAKEHPDRFKLIDRPGSRRGLGFDVAWRESRGRWIFIMGADRTWKPGMVAAVRRLAKKIRDRPVKIYSPLQDTKLGAILIPRTTMEAVDGFDVTLTYFEDTDLLRRLEAHGPVENATMDLYDLDWKGKMKRPGYLAGYYWGMYRDGARVGNRLGYMMRPALKRPRSWPFIVVGIVAYLWGLLNPKARSRKEAGRPGRP